MIDLAMAAFLFGAIIFVGTLLAIYFTNPADDDDDYFD